MGAYKSWLSYCTYKDRPNSSNIPNGGWFCKIGGNNNKKDKSILIIGDSHAGELIPFYDYIGKKYKIPFYISSSPHCIPIEGFNYNLSSYKSL
ncbi:SGNH hydrolase domain-containing protein [Xenorhabdus szentirmaii]|uniref:SGNH hydrolase domain-containing protein n=1 Tax=Xenorhabdus szentirmaii TaxID=290112 RepID=UPI0038CD3F31